MTTAGRQTKATRDTRPPSAYQRMRDDILTLALHPGMILDEQTLSARYGVSRSPIREALIRLSAEGLVIMSPRHNAQVAPLIMSDLPRYMESLELLQRSVHHLAAYRRLPSDIEKIQGAAERFERAAGGEDLAEMAVANTAFHVAVSEAGHNAYLTNAYSQILTQGQRMMRLPLLYAPRGHNETNGYLAAELQQHEAILAAVRDGDADSAEQLALEHCRHFRSALNAYLNENLTEEISVEASGDR